MICRVRAWTAIEQAVTSQDKEPQWARHSETQVENQNADRNQLGSAAFWQAQAIHPALSWSSLPSYEGLSGEKRYDDAVVHGHCDATRKRCGVGKCHAALHKPERSSSMRRRNNSKT
jgi:hypothetical protein